MKNGSATIIGFSEDGINAGAAASRISTGAGTALDAFGKSGNKEKDVKLVGKVISSGHTTVIEHCYFNIAFNDVSVLCEQLMIEHRLAAYTVKSRRYVDFSGAGYVVPEGLGDREEAFRAHIDGLFSAYDKLLALEIPREDARFVLPYCFRSNFIMSVNARELSHIVNEMTIGRLSVYPEMVYLGNMLMEQLDECFPGISSAEKKRIHAPMPLKNVSEIGIPALAEQNTEIVSAPVNARELLASAMAFEGADSIKDYVHSDRPRALEMLSYGFLAKDVSLATVTHFTRHRIQTLMVPEVATSLIKNHYILPETVATNAEAKRIYMEAFEKNACFAKEFIGNSVLLSYLALAGNTVDLLFGMNARELLHFLRLRTCTRAQWEVRGYSREMLALLRENFPELFKHYGPSCAVLGYCPEGRLSCGQPQKVED